MPLTYRIANRRNFTFMAGVGFILSGMLQSPLCGQVPVLFRSPVECRLNVDGDPLGVITAGGVLKTSIPRGDHVVSCAGLMSGVRVVDQFDMRVGGDEQIVQRINPQAKLSEVLAAAMRNTVVVKVGPADLTTYDDNCSIFWGGNFRNAFTLPANAAVGIVGIQVKICRVGAYDIVNALVSYGDRRAWAHYLALLFTDADGNIIPVDQKSDGGAH